MYCGGCGQALVAGQAYCHRCGRAYAAAMPPRAWAFTPLAYLERRINSLAVGWLVFAVFTALFGMAGMGFAHHMMESGWSDGSWSDHWHHGAHFPFFWGLGWKWIILRVGLAVAAGVGLMHKTSWGRGVALVAAVLALIHFPFGTILGIWTLVVLASRANGFGYQALVRG